MSLLRRLLRPTEPPLAQLYAAIVAAARRPDWYRDGVPDTTKGRYDLLSSLVALALLRLEAEGDEGRRRSVELTERFVDDMDGSLRQMGIGDLSVGKQVGRMMASLGGRLGAYRDAAGDEAALAAAVRRNVFHEDAALEPHVPAVTRRLARWRGALDALPAPAILAGEVPTP